MSSADVTSSFKAVALLWPPTRSESCSGLRAVANTRSPREISAWTNARPRPVEHPVTSQARGVLDMFVSCSFDRPSAGSSPIEGQHSRNDRSRPNDNHTREAVEDERQSVAVCIPAAFQIDQREDCRFIA